MEILIVIIMPFIMIYIIDKISGRNKFGAFIKYLFKY